MKVLKKLGVMGLVLGLTMGAVGCSNGSEDNKDDSAKKDEIVTLNVSAAASLQEAMVELEEKFKEVEPNVKLELNLGSSGSLQQQIEQGAACDVFISAGQKQMTALADKDLLLDGTNKTLLTNDLVLVTGEDKEIKDLDTLATDKVEKLAIGDPESVPAGKYAKEVLDNTKLYDKVENKLVLAKDVKEVLAWVASGNADVGFVYLSDALSSDSVTIVENIDEVNNHSSITYPVSVIKDSTNADEAKKFEDFLFTDAAQKIFEKYGYKSVK